jgi:hypothetical protein
MSDTNQTTASLITDYGTLPASVGCSKGAKVGICRPSALPPESTKMLGADEHATGTARFVFVYRYLASAMKKVENDHTPTLAIVIGPIADMTPTRADCVVTQGKWRRKEHCSTSWNEIIWIAR